MCLNFTILHDYNMICEVNELNRVSHQDTRLIFQEAKDDLLADLLADMGVQSGHRIVHKNDIRSLVYSPSEGHSGFLTT